MPEKRVSNRVRKAKELEERVGQWLTAAGAAFYPGGDFDSNLTTPIIMIDPFPMAFEVFPDAMISRFTIKVKRWLAGRIRIAQLFGPHLPVTVIFGEGSEDIPERVRNLFDRVLDARRLPNLNELRNVAPSEELERFFEIGQPSESADELLTGPEAFPDMWKNVLSLSDILTKPQPSASLAARLRQSSLRLVEEQESNDQPEVRLTEGEGAQINKFRKLVISSRFRNSFDQEIMSFLGEHADGKSRRIKLDIGPEGNLFRRQELAWEFPDGEIQVIRRYMSSNWEFFVANKAEEFFADAWMIRGSGKAGRRRPLLLLGESPQLQVSSTRGPVPKPSSITLDIVNRFESAGWRVFPWDFDREIPRFVEYLSNRDSVG